MKKLHSIMFLFLITLMSCKTDKTDALSSTRILGEWEITQRSVNNISSGAAICCEFIEFYLDGDGADFIGDYVTSSSGSQQNGVYEIDTETYTLFFYANDTLICDYSLNDAVLHLEYTKSGNHYVETWNKQ